MTVSIRPQDVLRQLYDVSSVAPLEMRFYVPQVRWE
jgi:hypothetical protein